MRPPMVSAYLCFLASSFFLTSFTAPSPFVSYCFLTRPLPFELTVPHLKPPGRCLKSSFFFHPFFFFLMSGFQGSPFSPGHGSLLTPGFVMAAIFCNCKRFPAGTPFCHPPRLCVFYFPLSSPGSHPFSTFDHLRFFLLVCPFQYFTGSFSHFLCCYTVAPVPALSPAAGVRRA